MARRHHRHHHRHHGHYNPNVQYTRINKPAEPVKATLSKSVKDIALPIKAIVITVILIILSIPQIHLLSFNGITSLSNLFTSRTLFANFIIIFALLLFYDFVTYRGARFYQETIGSFLGSIFLTVAKGNIPFLIIAILTIVIFYLGFLIGILLNKAIMTDRTRKMISGTIGILIFFWLIAIIFVYYGFVVPSSPISLNSTYLTQSQLNSTFGKNSSSGVGLYTVNRLNSPESTYGSVISVFPTPIQTVAFNLTFANTQAGSAYYVEYYNITSFNLTEYTLQTPQASIIFVTQAHSASSIGNVNGLQYFTKDNVIMASKGNYIAFITCAGSLCNGVNTYKLLQVVSQDFG